MLTLEDAVKVAPDSYKVLLENDRVRVVELTLHPGDEIPMHTHPDTLAYALTDIVNTWGYPDGSEENVTVKKGDVLWHEAFAHSGVNTGDKDQKFLLVEPKK